MSPFSRFRPMVLEPFEPRLLLSASLGNQAWLDLNGNGIAEAGEPGLGDVVVELLSAGADGQVGGGDDVSKGVVITNQAGAYQFGNLNAGAYYIKATAPAGFALTVANAGADDSVDSDVDPLSGLSGIILLDGSTVNLSLDIGLIGPPAAAADSYSTDEDQPLIVTVPQGVLANDSDPQGEPLAAELMSDVSHGSLVLRVDGSFDYIPAANFFGTDSFTYRVSDGDEFSATATVTITVNPVVDPAPPVAADDEYVLAGQAWTQSQKVIAGTPADFASFGADVAIDGDIAVVGATENMTGNGSVHVFKRNGDTWTFVQKLTAGDAGTDDQFGSAVAVSGNRIVVGAGAADTPGTNAGAAYVFDFNGTSWVQTHQFPATSGTFGVFGKDVAVDGDTIVVGVSGYDHSSAQNIGAAVVYQLIDGQWTQVTTLLSSDRQVDSSFGHAVSIFGSVIVVGSPNFDQASVTSLGAAYVFERGSTGWTQSGKFVGSGAGGNQFGFSVAANRDRIVVGQNGGGSGFLPTSLVRVIDRVNGVWTETATLTVENETISRHFGESVDVDGDRVVIGVPRSQAISPNSGAVYIFDFNGSTWSQTGLFHGNDVASGDEFAGSVAVDGLHLITGAFRNMHSNRNKPGAAYIAMPTLAEDRGIAVEAPGVLANDADLQGDPITAILVTTTSHGVLTFNADGSFTYIPDPDFSGIDTFTYRATDGVQLSDIRTVSLNVTAENDHPVAVGDVYAAGQASLIVPVAQGVLANDTDVDDSNLMVELVSEVSHGTLVLNADGSFTYRTTAGYTGIDSFTYRINDGQDYSSVVTVQINVSLDPAGPVATDDFYTAQEDSRFSASVEQWMRTSMADFGRGVFSGTMTSLFDEVTLESTLTSVANFMTPNNGSTTFHSAFEKPYYIVDVVQATSSRLLTKITLPTQGYSAGNTIEYVVYESMSADGEFTKIHSNFWTAPQTVAGNPTIDSGTIAVPLVEGRFYMIGIGSERAHSYPVRNTSVAAVTSVGPVIGSRIGYVDHPTPDTLTGFDTQSNRYQIGIQTSAPQNFVAGGVYTSYLIEAQQLDSWGTLNFNAVVPAGSTLTIDILPETGDTSIPGFTNLSSGADLSGLSESKIRLRVTMTRASLTVSPSLLDWSVTWSELPGLPGSVLENDTDSESDPLTARLITGPSHGTLEFYDDGTFYYTPDLDFVGVDSFTYVANDGIDDSLPATVTITVEPIDEAPIADAGGPYVIDEGDDLSLDATGSIDPDEGLLNYEWDLDNDGEFDDAIGATPELTWDDLVELGLGDNGTYTISVRAENATGFDTDTVTLTINNVAPRLVVTVPATVAKGEPIQVSLSSFDPGDDQIIKWVINWGDGTTSTVTGNPPSIARTYTTEGVYQIIATAFDEDGQYVAFDLWIADSTTGVVSRFDGNTMQFISSTDVVAALSQPRAMAFGPDGNLYVSGFGSNNVLRFDGITGDFIDEFVTAGTGLNGPRGLAFGPDGNLYVAAAGGVIRFDGRTGDFIDTFIVTGGVLSSPGFLAFGPDGNLYISSYATDDVRKFHGETGAFLSVFINGGSPSTFVTDVEGMSFGHDGNLYLTATDFRVFDGVTGVRLGLINPNGPDFSQGRGPVMAPSGDLFAISSYNGHVRQYSSTWQFIRTFAQTGQDGLVAPSVLITSPPQIRVVGNTLGNFVWNDANRDGIQDAGEAGFAGVEVELYDAGEDGIISGDDTFIAAVLTSSTGAYSFTNLTAGNYYMQFNLPVNRGFSPPNVGGDDARDSDVDPATGFTDVFSLATSSINLKHDAGLILVAPPTDIALTASPTAENAVIGTIMGLFATTDLNVGDTFTYTLAQGVGDGDNAKFSVVGNTLRSATAFDFETQNSFSIRVRSTDASGLFIEESFTISITDVLEGPQLRLSVGGSPVEFEGAVDFGGLGLNNKNVIKTFTLRNDGTQPLNLTGSPIIEIQGLDADDYEVLTQPAGTIAPGGVTTFQIRFDPSVLGPRAASITIISNDADHASFTIGLEGTGQVASGPTVLSIAAIDAEAAETDDSETPNTATFRITRDGSADQELIVKFTRKGTAKFGPTGDYTLSIDGEPLTTTSFIMPAGIDQMDILVTTVDNALVEALESVIITLSTNTGYALDPSPANRTATALVADDEPLVTITVIDDVAAENAIDEAVNTATYRISRTGSTAAPLMVYFRRSGNAKFSPTGDYVLSADGNSVTTSVVIPAGQDHVDLVLTAIDNATIESAEQAIITLLSKKTYNLDPLKTNRAQSVTINDNESTVSITAIDSVASEPGAGDNPGRFIITRTGSTATDLLVKLRKTGTASSSDLVALPKTIVIPAGESSVTIDVIALADTKTEVTESVVLTLVASSPYNLPALLADRSATVQINDGGPVLSGVDLAILSASYSTSTISLSDPNPLNITPRIINQGAQASTGYMIRYFLSLDRSLDEEDFLAFTDVSTALLASGKSLSHKTKITSWFDDVAILPEPDRYFLVIQIVSDETDSITAGNTWIGNLNNIVITA